MEHYQGFDPITVLKVRDICCKVYQKKLKKEVLKLDGVYSVEINPENGLVSIKGNVDPNILLKTVSRTGKSAEIVSPNKNPNRHRNCCCEETNYKCHKMEEEEEHKCEDYVPPLINERICRDYYCKSHRMMRPIFRDHFPRFLGHFPKHAGGGPYGPRWFAEEPPPFAGYGFRSRSRLSGFENYSYSAGYGDDATRYCNIM